MERKQLENIYVANGLNDFILKKAEDLFKIHGVDIKAVEGYSRLDDVNKHLYEKFIINFYNASGLVSRAELVPKGIYYVEDVEFLAKRNPEDDCFVVKGGTVKAIDKNGIKSVIHSWEDEDFQHLVTLTSESSIYLRFEYERNSENSWQHVIGEKTWY